MGIPHLSFLLHRFYAGAGHPSRGNPARRGQGKQPDRIVYLTYGVLCYYQAADSASFRGVVVPEHGWKVPELSICSEQPVRPVPVIVIGQVPPHPDPLKDETGDPQDPDR